jgi:hypothetical protein
VRAAAALTQRQQRKWDVQLTAAGGAGPGRILVAAIFATLRGEVIATIRIAMLACFPSASLRDGVLGHPTMAEGPHQLFASWTD